jgi:hypothetical protein
MAEMISFMTSLAFHGEFFFVFVFLTKAAIEPALLKLDKAPECADPDHHQQGRAVAEQEQEQVSGTGVLAGSLSVTHSE